MFNYSIISKNSQIYIKIFLFLFILSLFFPIRHVFLTKEAYFTGDYSDFTSFSLYLSDILLFILAFVSIFTNYDNIRLKFKGFLLLTSYFLIFLILGLFLSFFIHLGLNTRLNFYFLLRWFELLVAYETFLILFREISLKILFLKLFAWFCGLEAILALAQFAKQSSLGLYRLGESHLSPTILGVAKIVSSETTFIRGYGTFPHPNPFSAFLVTGILITTWLLITSTSLKSRIIYSLLLFINILGLTVTFSRGAYLALGAGLVIFFGIPFMKSSKINLKQSLKTIVVILASVITAIIIFKPFLISRATFSDQSTIDRKFYDVIGLKMAEKNPILGLGLGESALMMEKYSGKILQPWEIQPPHNYFIITAAELGMPMAILLLLFFLWHIKTIFFKLNQEFSPYLLSLISILLSFLILMQFDHYFYTLQQTQLLLWLVLALISGEIKNPRVGDSTKT